MRADDLDDQDDNRDHHDDGRRTTTTATNKDLDDRPAPTRPDYTATILVLYWLLYPYYTGSALALRCNGTTVAPYTGTLYWHPILALYTGTLCWHSILALYTGTLAWHYTGTMLVHHW